MKSKKVAISLGITWAIIFVICSIWGMFIQSGDLKSFWTKLMTLYYPGFSLTLQGLILGAVEAFIYGFVIGHIFAFVYKKTK